MTAELSLAEDDVGEQMHTGLRLSHLRIEQRLSSDIPWLVPLHDLKVELVFHYRKVVETWTRGHIITLVIGAVAFLLGTWDLGIGEISSGGDIWKVGIEGLETVAWQSFALMMMSFALWIAFMFRLMAQFPLLRGQTMYLFVGWFGVQVGMLSAHALSPRFPLGAEVSGFIWLFAAIVILGFITFILGQAVIETRNVHVETKHAHPDPRRMEESMRDHSLVAWCVVLVCWCVLVVVNSWFAAHSVAFRSPSGVWAVFYFLTGILMLFFMLHLLWFPQMMLGGAGEAIESDRAREVSRELRGEEIVQTRQKGVCPTCSSATSVSRLGSGVIEVVCQDGECRGTGKPTERCPECSKVLPSRITCQSCGTSAPVLDHLPDDDAW